jgi:hypothetical protein
MAFGRYPCFTLDSGCKLIKMEIYVLNWLAWYYGVDIDEKERSRKPTVAFAKRKIRIGEYYNIGNS